MNENTNSLTWKNISATILGILFFAFGISVILYFGVSAESLTAFVVCIYLSKLSFKQTTYFTKIFTRKRVVMGVVVCVLSIFFVFIIKIVANTGDAHLNGIVFFLSVAAIAVMLGLFTTDRLF